MAVEAFSEEWARLFKDEVNKSATYKAAAKADTGTGKADANGTTGKSDTSAKTESKESKPAAKGDNSTT